MNYLSLLNYLTQSNVGYSISLLFSSLRRAFTHHYQHSIKSKFPKPHIVLVLIFYHLLKPVLCSMYQPIFWISQLFEIIESSFLQPKILSDFCVWESDISPYHHGKVFFRKLLLWPFSNITKSREKRIIKPIFTFLFYLCTLFQLFEYLIQ